MLGLTKIRDVSNTGRADIFTPESVNYVLRYYLPVWSAEKRITELVDFCNFTGANHIMFVCGPHHMHWNIIPLDEALEEAQCLMQAKTKLNENGIRMGINVTATLGHFKSRWDHTQKFPSIGHWLTDMDGNINKSMPCSLDSGFRTYIKEIYQTYAQCLPDYLFVDDDLRCELGPRKWGCLCDLHMEGFSCFTNRDWTRNALVKSLRTEQPVRAKWIEFCGQSLVGLAEHITGAVRDVNSDVPIGMMVPCVHTLPVMGHNLTNVLDALHSGGKPLLRPPIGPYQDHNRRDIVGGIVYIEQISHFLDDRDPVYTPELEMAPFTRFSKSMTVIRFQMAQAIMNKMYNPAISLAGYVGDPIDVEPAFKKFLSQEKPFFDSLCKMKLSPKARKGIGLLFDFDSAKTTKGFCNNPSDLAWPSFVLSKTLGSMGLPYTFEESTIHLLAGDSVRNFSKSKIMEILSRGAILEANATKALIEMGYGDLIGVNEVEFIENWAAEKYIAPEFTGPYTDTYTPLSAANFDLYRMSLIRGVKVISQVVGHDREELASGMCIYINGFGGKIAVLPFTITSNEGDSRHLLCYARKFVLRKIQQWMNPYAVAAFVENPSDFLVQTWEDNDSSTICLTNLSYDCCQELELIIANPQKLSPTDAQYLADDGQFVKVDIIESKQVDIGIHRWRIRHKFYAFRPFVMRIKSQSR